VKYAWISEHRDSYPVKVMCRVLKVARSGYYTSVDRKPPPRALRTAKIHQAVERVHTDSHGIYGSAKIAERLQQDDALESACRNTVATAMRELGLKSRVRRAFTPTTTKSDPTKQPAPNVLNRDFTADVPNRKWVTDISVPQKRRERWEFGLPRSAYRSRSQTTISGCD
jgi:putative transposase